MAEFGIVYGTGTADGTAPDPAVAHLDALAAVVVAAITNSQTALDILATAVEAERKRQARRR